uniref:Ig-like domain-containing protein n=1 Tax=Sander lucioperca TaxID=283035 RepID=A0A8C9Y6I0_SANLU
MDKEIYYCLTSVIEGEITAEAGLCVVIPCSFTTSYYFTPQHIVWYKCEPSKQKCADSDMIFHTNKNNNKTQSGFKGRVSLLEPDVSRGNCSIIVNDLTESDSGLYQLKVNGYLNQKTDGFTFSPRTNVSTALPLGLTQKPTVMIPPLTEGQQSTLSCTAPGLCSGSDPEISWTWRGNLTAVSQRHSSTLTFNSSAEHHGTNVSCKVSFTNNITTEETVTLNGCYNIEYSVSFCLIDVKEVKITGDTSVKEGETLNLTCSVESFPPSLITWTKLCMNRTLNNDTGTATLVISNMTTEYSGQYICTAKHQDNPLTKEVNITVICNEGFPLPECLFAPPVRIASATQLSYSHPVT